MKIVNIAGTGDIGREIDLEQFVEDVDLPVANYDPKFNAAFLRFEEEAGEIVILYNSGKYIIRGGDSYDRMADIRRQFLAILDGLGISSKSDAYRTTNVVCVYDLNYEVNLNKLSIILGLEAIEYEPEQFPGLIYRPVDSTCVLLIFSSGKVVITGGQSKEDAEIALKLLKEDVEPISTANSV